MAETITAETGKTIWEPLGDGIAYYKTKGGILYRSREGQLVFAADPDAFAAALSKTIGAEVERVLRRAMNGELVDPVALAAQAEKIRSEAMAAGVDLAALGLK